MGTMLQLPLLYMEFRAYPGLRAVMTVAVVLLCVLPPGRKLALWAASRLKQLSARPVWAAVMLIAVALAVTAGLAFKRGLPLPSVHDEFSYLLGADTFAHGRLTNPTPPGWQHFESMHILVKPSYNSKYPPGQAMTLAAGQVLTGEPVFGLWLATAGACLLAWWMLRAFVPSHWALLGALMLAIHPQMLEWAHRYWGGTVAVLGGLLLLGGFARILNRMADQFPGTALRSIDAVWAALGMLILANSRPFEGAVLALLLAFWFVAALWRTRIALTLAWRRIFAPAAIVLAMGMGWMGYYNWRVTGDPLRLPYQEHQQQYAAVPLFIFQKAPHPPTYRHRELEKFQVVEQGFWYARYDSWPKLRAEALANLRRMYDGAFRAVSTEAQDWHVSSLILPLIALPWLLRSDRRLRWLLAVLLIFAAALLSETFMYPHYAAPVAGVLMAILAICLAWLWRGGGKRRVLAIVVMATYVLYAGHWWIGFLNMPQDSLAISRASVMNHFRQMPGQHLVVIRYSETHNVHQEWVYNGADLPNEKVIFAREMDEPSMQRLLAAYPQHQVWLLEPDGGGLLPAGPTTAPSPTQP